MSRTKKGLGRGLGALLPEVQEKELVTEVAVEEIVPSRYQPREQFDEGKLEELVQSVQEHGVVQPVLVRPRPGGYELVAGERRWRAALKVGLSSIPAVVKELSDVELMEIALVENLQREDLNPIEEAKAYAKLIKEFGLTQEQLARRVGKSRPQIANTLRLLHLDEELQKAILDGQISMGHAKVLLAIEEPSVRKEVATRVLQGKLSVRETEGLLVKSKPRGRKRPGKQAGKDPQLLELEEVLRASLGTRVRIISGRKKGKIEIEYYGTGDLERITGLLMGYQGENKRTVLLSG